MLSRENIPLQQKCSTNAKFFVSQGSCFCNVFRTFIPAAFQLALYLLCKIIPSADIPLNSAIEKSPLMQLCFSTSRGILSMFRFYWTGS